VHHPKLSPTILKVDSDGCTNILVMIITIVFKLVRSQIL
jgi:hypothetical protein